MSSTPLAEGHVVTDPFDSIRKSVRIALDEAREGMNAALQDARQTMNEALQDAKASVAEAREAVEEGLLSSLRQPFESDEESEPPPPPTALQPPPRRLLALIDETTQIATQLQSDIDEAHQELRRLRNRTS